ncbi:sigma 54-interacting transcriptional regulator [Rhizobiaceae bacterium]|nr:sigma 54-interacting transcriptional regulator [Rhizobiaceae bacterium]
MNHGIPGLISAVHHAPVASLLVDLESDRILAANDAAGILLARANVVGSHFLPFVQDGKSELVVFVDSVAHRGRGWTRAVTLQTADGKAVECELRGQVFGEAGAASLLLNILDIAELQNRAQRQDEARLHHAGLFQWRRAEAFFSELERENRLILEAAGEGIYGVNAQGEATFVNRAAQEMLGWTVEDLLGRDIHATIHHHHLDGSTYPRSECPIYRSFRAEQTNRVENEVFWRKDGKPIRVEYVSTPIYDQRILVGAVVIFRDITERKENEQKLHEAMEEVGRLRDRLEQENAYLIAEMTSHHARQEIVGCSPAIANQRAQIELVAGSDANVFITGESGTGKALAASAIHKASQRRRRPLVRVNCAALAPDALEKELFGEAGGSDGKVALARGGTLYLEEVSELPSRLQSRLLQVLRSGRDGQKNRNLSPADTLRTIACSRRDLEREVGAGRLRKDLYFHLNVVPIACRPLRSRPEDVPLLAAHFLQLICRRLYRTEPVITKGLIAAMQAYDWPGNVRELENVIERGVILSKGDKLSINPSTLGGEAQTSAGDNARLLTDRELRRIERDNLLATLRAANGRISGEGGAANLLGLRPTTLRSRLKAFDIVAKELEIGRNR